jgi:hypothetical protein
MATSRFDILNIEDMEDIIARVVDDTDSQDVPVYEDAMILRQITRAETMVFASIHNTYTSSTITIEALQGIEEMAKIFMENILIRDGWITDKEYVNEREYFEAYVKDSLILQPEKEKGSLKSANTLESLASGVEDF